MMGKILIWEDKIKLWIETHRFLWILILLSLGVAIGMGSNYSLGGDFQQGMIMSSVFSSGLIICELVTGGKGVE